MMTNRWRGGAVAFAAAWCLVWGAVAGASDGGTGAFRVRLFDRTTGKPVEGATVELTAPGSATRTAASDADGSVAWSGLAPGIYAAKVTSRGYVTLASPSVPISAGPAAVERMVGLLPGVMLSGRVVGADGAALAGAKVCMAPLHGTASSGAALGFAPITGTGGPACAVASADGAVPLPALPAGAYQVTVRAPRHAAIESGRFDLGAGSPAVTWALSPAGSLVARIVDESGHGVPDAKVSLKDRLRGTTVQASTDGTGAVRVDGLAEGYWRVEVEPAEHRSLLRDNVRVEPQDVTDLGTLRARAASFAEGRIIGFDGAPVAGAEVRVQESGGARRLLRSATSDEKGRFRVGGLPAGTKVDLLVRPKQGWAPRTFERMEPPVVDGKFAVDASVRVAGRAVVDKDAAIPRGARVVAWPRPGNPSFDANAGLTATATVDQETGAFSVEGVPPGGPVEVRLYAPGLGEASATLNLEGGKDVPPLELFPRKNGQVLRGRVVDASGNPVAGARLGAASTDAQGRFVLEGLEPGQNRLIVQHPSHAPLAHTFAADATEETTLVLEEGGTVEGAVTDARGRPVVGARVATDFPGVYAVTGAGGRYRIEHVPAGPTGIVRQATGVSGDTERRKVTVAAGETRTLDFRLAAGSLEGAIARGGEPVGSAAISVRQPFEADAGPKAEEYLLQSATSDEDGRYRVVGLRPGAAIATLNDGKQSLTFPVKVGDDASARLDIDLPAHPLEGVVLDPSGKPVAGACVASGLERLAADAAEGDAYTRTSTDGQGRFLLYTEEASPEMVTVCTCAQGCKDVRVDSSAEGSATLWY